MPVTTDRVRGTDSRCSRLWSFAPAALIVTAGCAVKFNPLTGTPADSGETAGFLLGLWHGLIMPFAFVASLFLDNVSIYEVHNNGGWYNFGYLLGLGSTLGGGSSAAAHSS